MLWIDKASLANCTQFGTAAAVASALSFSVTCIPQKPSTQQAALAAKPTVTLASVKPETPNLLPAVEPHPIPVQPPINCAVEACLALTFDDGPHAQTTPQLLDVLAAHQARATFFMLGSQAAKYPHIVKRVEAEGHEIGSHSWIHRDFTKMTPQEMIDDLNQTQQTLYAAGATSVHLFRPPYGARNDTVRNIVPFSLALWNIDPEDWREQDPHQLAARIIATAKPGGVLVLHDIKPVTVAAAPQFVATLKQHYKLVTMSQLLAVSPTTPKAEYRGR